MVLPGTGCSSDAAAPACARRRWLRLRPDRISVFLTTQKGSAVCSIFIPNTSEQVSLTPTPTFSLPLLWKIAWDLHLSFCKGLKALYLQVTMLFQKLLPVPVIYCIKRICIVLTLEEPCSSWVQSCIKCISLHV